MKKIQKTFIGRRYELSCLEDEFVRDCASLVVLHGRRRVGKTRLLAQFCLKKQFLRFEGLEKGSPLEQIENFLKQLAQQTKNHLFNKVATSSWRETFELLTPILASSKNKLVLIFDEFPWMIAEDEKVIALFKYFWDNIWSRHKGLMIVFCGSVNTFMVKKVLFASALYGRINREICLGPLNPEEVHQFLSGQRSIRETLDLYMVFGGIPKYLEEINTRESAVQNINRLCFLKDAFFVREFDRLFLNEFKKPNVYTKIVEILAKHTNLNYSEIARALKTKPGGGYQEYLKNLALAGFVQSYTPLNKEGTQLIRYRLTDEFLLFYFEMMRPHLGLIHENTGGNLFLNFVGKQKWSIWAGLAFERFCLKRAQKIQEVLKIDQLVKNHGSYFTRQTTDKNGLQIDLLFERHDRVVTLCEIKYHTRPIGVEIITGVEKKAALLKIHKNQTIEKVLITVSPPANSLVETHYFSRILVLEDLMGHI